MERDFGDALIDLEDAFEKHEGGHQYDSQQALILNNNYFWDSDGLIRVLANDFLAHDSPEKLGMHFNTTIYDLQ